MALEGKRQPRSGPQNTDHGSISHERIRELVSGRGASKALPDTRRGGHDHRQGPPASEGEQAVNKLGRSLKRT